MTASKLPVEGAFWLGRLHAQLARYVDMYEDLPDKVGLHFRRRQLRDGLVQVDCGIQHKADKPVGSWYDLAQLHRDSAEACINECKLLVKNAAPPVPVYDDGEITL